MEFFYGPDGSIDGFNYKASAGGTRNSYYYVKNLQGDVVAIVNKNGEVKAEYTYDPFGKVLTATGTMADVNPIRYRGYYYDTESGFYYLQSRYYDPNICRFINADGLASTGQGFIGTNMFAYCNNNPVNMVDCCGEDAIILIDNNNVGHLGLLIQNADGDWIHYYWGSVYAGTSSSSFCFLPFDSKVNEVYSVYTGNTDVESINQSNVYSGDYEDMYYLEGDFTKAFEYLAEHGDEKYSLYRNNCSQHSLRALAYCDTPYSEELMKVSEITRPKKAFRTFTDNMDKAA